MAREPLLAKRRRLGAWGYRHRQAAAFGQLTPALAAFVFVYLAALVVLFISAFWTVDEFTGELVHSWTFSNFQTLWDGQAYHTIALRTIGIAAAVTVADAVLAFPVAYYMARVASRGTSVPSTWTAMLSGTGGRALSGKMHVAISPVMAWSEDTSSACVFAR